MSRPLVYCCLAASASFFCSTRVNAENTTTSVHGAPKSGLSDGPKLRTWELNARAGIAYFVHARSLALEHRLKPAVRAAAWTPFSESVDFGAGFTIVADTSPNYGVWGAYGFGRYRFLDDGFRLSAELGAGLGHNAPILHEDLRSGGSLLPYLYVGLVALIPLSERLNFGLEVADEQISVLHLGAALTYRL